MRGSGGKRRGGGGRWRSDFDFVRSFSFFEEENCESRAATRVNSLRKGQVIVVRKGKRFLVVISWEKRKGTREREGRLLRELVPDRERRGERSAEL